MNILTLAQQTKALAEKTTPVLPEETWNLITNTVSIQFNCSGDNARDCCYELTPEQSEPVIAALEYYQELAHARTAAPQLADAVIRLEAEKEEVMSTLRKIAKHCSGTVCDDSISPTCSMVNLWARALLTRLGVTEGNDTSDASTKLGIPASPENTMHENIDKGLYQAARANSGLKPEGGE